MSKCQTWVESGPAGIRDARRDTSRGLRGLFDAPEYNGSRPALAR